MANMYYIINALLLLWIPLATTDCDRGGTSYPTGTKLAVPQYNNCVDYTTAVTAFDVCDNLGNWDIEDVEPYCSDGEQCRLDNVSVSVACVLVQCERDGVSYNVGYRLSVPEYDRCGGDK